MSVALITTNRAILSPQLAALNATNPNELQNLIYAASGLIERECHRHFTQQDYVQYINGGIYKYEPLLLPECPVQQITRLAMMPEVALTITNTDQSIQRATVSTTATATTCVSITAGMSTTSTFSYTNQTTCGTLATAINNINSGADGWNAQVGQDFTNWTSSDIKYISGAYSANNGSGAILLIYSENVQPWNYWSYDPWSGFGTNYGWQLDAEKGMIFGVFPSGQQNIRIDYSAGFDPIPDPIQEAVVITVIDMYSRELIQAGYLEQHLGPYGVKNNVSLRLSPYAWELISPYILHDKVLFQDGNS